MNPPQDVTVENQIRNGSSSSKYRVARWRERKRRNVLYMASVEVMGRDLRVLKRFGHLASDDPEMVTKGEFETALCSLLDSLARRLRLFGAGSGTSAQSKQYSASLSIR